MIVELIQDGDDLVLPLGNEMCQELGWNIGDTLEFVDNKDGTWTMKKQIEETEIVLVEAVSSFRMTYAVRVPKNKQDWALEDVVAREASEIAQEHLGEQIFSHRVVSTQEYLQEFDLRNIWARGWTQEQKLNQISKI